MLDKKPSLQAPVYDNIRELTAWRKSLAKKGTTCALIAGSFRILHPGNLKCIAEAAGKFGGVCAMIDPANSTSDSPAGLGDRAGLLALVRGVDAVAGPTHEKIVSALHVLRPFVMADCLAQPAITILQKTARTLADNVFNIKPLKECFTNDIEKSIRSGQTPINVPVSQLAPGDREIGSVLADLAGKKIVTVNGCFDILHPGHARLLTEASRMGDALIVLVNDDQSVKRHKGIKRPVFPIQCRLSALKSLTPVTAAFSFAGDNPLPTLALIRPAIHVKGGSFVKERVQNEKELVESWGGRIEFVPMLENFSTTNLIENLT